VVDNFAQIIWISFVLMQFTNALVKPVVELVNLLLEHGDWRGHLISIWPLYFTAAVAGTLGWYAHYNMLPMLDAPLGEILTAIGIGLGPSFLYDLQDRPDPQVVVQIAEEGDFAN